MAVPQRKNPRLTGYDYSQNGAYFVTVCTHDRANLLSTVGRGLAPATGLAPAAPTIALSLIGEILEAQLLSLPQLYPNVTIEKYIIMPNHLHLLISFDDTAGASPRPTLSEVVCTCKSLTTRLANIAEHQPGRKIFQTSFYDEIIRNDTHFLNVWQYIDANPAGWTEDEYYTA